MICPICCLHYSTRNPNQFVPKNARYIQLLHVWDSIIRSWWGKNTFMQKIAKQLEKPTFKFCFLFPSPQLNYFISELSVGPARNHSWIIPQFHGLGEEHISFPRLKSIKSTPTHPFLNFFPLGLAQSSAKKPRPEYSHFPQQRIASDLHILPPPN